MQSFHYQRRKKLMEKYHAIKMEMALDEMRGLQTSDCRFVVQAKDGNVLFHSFGKKLGSEQGLGEELLSSLLRIADRYCLRVELWVTAPKLYMMYRRHGFVEYYYNHDNFYCRMIRVP